MSYFTGYELDVRERFRGFNIVIEVVDDRQQKWKLCVWHELSDDMNAIDNLGLCIPLKLNPDWKSKWQKLYNSRGGLLNCNFTRHGSRAEFDAYHREKYSSESKYQDVNGQTERQLYWDPEMGEQKLGVWYFVNHNPGTGEFAKPLLRFERGTTTWLKCNASLAEIKNQYAVCLEHDYIPLSFNYGGEYGAALNEKINADTARKFWFERAVESFAVESLKHSKLDAYMRVGVFYPVPRLFGNSKFIDNENYERTFKLASKLGVGVVVHKNFHKTEETWQATLSKMYKDGFEAELVARLEDKIFIIFKNNSKKNSKLQIVELFYSRNRGGNNAGGSENEGRDLKRRRLERMFLELRL